jgi:diguanylate cyclase (GGDEF)-like protein
VLPLAALLSATIALAATAVVLVSGATQPWLSAAAATQAAAVGLGLASWFAARRRLARVTQMTEYDPATGCLNRRGFARALGETLQSAVAMHGDVALLAIDLDHFKQINDRYGHNVGDVVLSEVAATLAGTVGDKGVVARVGGEEFLVLLPNADAELAGVLAEQMVSRLRAQRIVSLTPGAVVTMSVGIAAEQVMTLRVGAALRARADEALYMAKRGGRDRILLWAPGVRSHATPAAAAAAIMRSAGHQAIGQPPQRTSGGLQLFR